MEAVLLSGIKVTNSDLKSESAFRSMGAIREIGMEEKAALEEMRRLAAQYKLSFTFNPGGGEFYKDGWRCQISCEDDVYDLECLKKALADIINPN